MRSSSTRVVRAVAGVVAAFFVCAAHAANTVHEAMAGISGEAILEDVKFLASDELKGRYARSPEAFRAARWIAARFESLGLAPIGESYFHDVQDKAMSPNVIAIRPGVSERIVLITAHYDHLRPAAPDSQDVRNGDRIFNGADDNASGTSGMLAIARAVASLAESDVPATFIFIAFTGEEAGLRGSRFVAAQPPFEMNRVVAMFNLDLISRGEDDLIFIDGPRNADGLRDALRRANEANGIGLRIEFDKHPDWLMRSDQAPFLFRKVPAVLLSVEDHPDYHEVTDHAEKILPKLAERVSRLVFAAAVDIAANAQNEPRP